MSLGLQPRRATGYTKRRQASRQQEETGIVYTLHQQQRAAVLDVGPANRSPSGTGQADGSAPTCSTVRRACAEDDPRRKRLDARSPQGLITLGWIMHESAFITGAAAALAPHSAESTDAAVITSPSAESPVQSSSQQQGNTTPNMGIRKYAVITVSGKEKKWAEQRYRSCAIG